MSFDTVLYEIDGDMQFPDNEIFNVKKTFNNEQEAITYFNKLKKTYPKSEIVLVQHWMKELDYYVNL